MEHPIVKVSVSFEGFRRECSKEIAFNIFEDAFQSIDVPSSDAAGFVRAFITTNPDKIKVTLEKRQQLATALSGAITESLLELMSSNDLEMGYSKKSIVNKG